MHHSERLSPRQVVKEAEAILKEDRDFTGLNAVSAAEEIVGNFKSESPILEVDLQPETLEFLSTVYAEQAISEQSRSESLNTNEAAELPDPTIGEGIAAVLFSKLETIRSLQTRFPGATRLTLREARVIVRDLSNTIAALKKSGDIEQLKMYRNFYRTIKNVFNEAIKKSPEVDQAELEGVIDIPQQTKS